MLFRQGLELWRPFTSLIYLGPLSMSWLTNVYFLTQHGTRLELVSGTAEQVVFLIVTVGEHPTTVANGTVL